MSVAVDLAGTGPSASSPLARDAGAYEDNLEFLTALEDEIEDWISQTLGK